MSRPHYPKTWNTDYACPACGYTAAVQFVDPAAYNEADPVEGRDPGTQAEALKEAQAKLEKSTLRALRLCGCPACKTRDAQEVKRSYLWAALPLLGATPAMFVIALIVLVQVAGQHRLGLSPQVWALMVAVLLSCGVVFWGQRRLVAEAARALRFTPRPAPVKDGKG